LKDTGKVVEAIYGKTFDVDLECPRISLRERIRPVSLTDPKLFHIKISRRARRRAHAHYNLSRGTQSATTQTMHTIRMPIAM
jgi:hypothetical protein